MLPADHRQAERWPQQQSQQRGTAERRPDMGSTPRPEFPGASSVRRQYGLWCRRRGRVGRARPLSLQKARLISLTRSSSTINGFYMPERAIPPGSVVFLFNHDVTHQLAHAAGILKAVAETCPQFPLVCAFGTDAIERKLRDIIGEFAADILWFDLALPRFSFFARALNKIAPSERLMRLRYHGDSLKNAAVIVSTERTCLRLKRKWGSEGPQFIFVPHGAGDRSVTYHPDMVDFDAMLVSGQKVADEMIGHSLAHQDNVEIIGYPKFDVINSERRQRFFDNDKPVFLYNPHFDPYLSSWYSHGHEIVNWFAFGPGRDFNLILAPHIMLFRKKLHVSLEYKVAKMRPEIDPRWSDLPNILVDVSSDLLCDMSYTIGSDVYIGDVSSQIYEFLLHARPAFFIDTHSPRGSELPYLSWQSGDVVRSADQLFGLLPDFRDRGRHYHARQLEIFDYTMSSGGLSSSERGAQALISWLSCGRFDKKVG